VVCFCWLLFLSTVVICMSGRMPKWRLGQSREGFSQTWSQIRFMLICQLFSMFATIIDLGCYCTISVMLIKLQISKKTKFYSILPKKFLYIKRQYTSWVTQLDNNFSHEEIQSFFSIFLYSCIAQAGSRYSSSMHSLNTSGSQAWLIKLLL